MWGGPNRDAGQRANDREYCRWRLSPERKPGSGKGDAGTASVRSLRRRWECHRRSPRSVAVPLWSTARRTARTASDLADRPVRLRTKNRAAAVCRAELRVSRLARLDQETRNQAPPRVQATMFERKLGASACPG